ncbi:MAG: DUF192 domain-containing protein [Phycisphaeraceae bacterium]|nr:DUF192 domain-containing protein [Phycisphaeraceae bacterium]
MASQGRSMMGKLIGVLAFLAVAGAIAISIGGGLGDGSKGNERVVLAPTMTVKLKDKPFKLEVAATNEARIKGMGGRTEIPPGTGMLFVFPRAQRLSFLMRDCPIPIDVLFIDATTHHGDPHHATRGAATPRRRRLRLRRTAQEVLKPLPRPIRDRDRGRHGLETRNHRGRESRHRHSQTLQGVRTRTRQNRIQRLLPRTCRVIRSG